MKLRGLFAIGLLVGCSTAKEQARFTLSAAPDAGGEPTAAPDSGPSFNTDPDAGGAVCVPSKGNYDIPGNNCDDDGDGITDNVAPCDGSLAVEGDAAAFAKALGICRSADDGGWGLVSATYLDGYASSGTPNAGQHGILSKFGSVLKPREGDRLGVLSSGYAREYNNAAGTYGASSCFRNSQTMGQGYAAASLPPGYPKSTSTCVASTVAYDAVVVRLKLRTPANAKGLSFNFNFLSGEWPEYVCTSYNDGFLAMLTSKAFNNGAPDNISFDPQQRPVSVNNGFFDRCEGGTTTCGKSTCAGGGGELWGTGFYCAGNHCYSSGKEDTGGGATGWLETQAPIQASEEITLDFLIWDTGDSAFDSSVLLDNFQWIASETKIYTDRPR